MPNKRLQVKPTLCIHQHQKQGASPRMIERYWSRFADTYDRNQQYVVGQEVLDRIKMELDALPELGEVLELGCGTGYFTEAIAEKSTNVLATDLSDSLLEVAKKRLGDHPQVTVQNENCMGTSFLPGAFGCVIMANLIHVVETPDTVLRECNRILTEGGILVIVKYTGHGMKLWEKVKMGVRFSRTWGKPPEHTHSFSPKDLTSMMDDAGFAVEIADCDLLSFSPTRRLSSIIGQKGTSHHELGSDSCSRSVGRRLGGLGHSDLSRGSDQTKHRRRRNGHLRKHHDGIQ